MSSDNIKALLDASGNTTAPYWPALFAGMLKNNKIEALVQTGGAGGGGGGGAGAGAAAAPAAAADAPAAEAKKEKPKEEEVDPLAGGMDMFGSSGGGGDY